MTKNNIFPQCSLCGQVPEGGLHDGLRVMGQFICSSCESELTDLKDDDPRYGQLVALINKAFAKPIQNMMTQV